MTEQVVDIEQLGSLAEAAGADAVRMIIDAFWESTRELTAQLQVSISSKDSEGCKQVGHALKGSAANVGASLLAERAKVIEETARAGDLSSMEALLSAFVADISNTENAIDELLQKYA